MSTSVTGTALRTYFNQRHFGVFPQNRLCRGVLVLPEDHAEYLRGRHRQALRTNLRRANDAGIRCEAIACPRTAYEEVAQIVDNRQSSPRTPDEPAVLAGWAETFSAPGVTLMVSRGPDGQPLAIIAAVIDDAVCLIRVAVACSHLARWALHDHLVRLLIARRVTYLLAEGGGSFGVVGLSANLARYQRLLGYELLHVRPTVARSQPPKR